MMNNEYRTMPAAWQASRLVMVLAGLYVCMIVSGCGCLGYKLGTTLPSNIKTVFVPTFVNGTQEPQIEIKTTSMAIQEFRKDGSLRVVDADTADTKLEVTIVAYELVPLRYEQARAKAGSEYRMTLRAKVVFRAMDTSKVISESLVSGDATFLLSGDMATAKAKALPIAARDLAHDIVESVVEYWQ
jgi:hypothetical protein